jgi:hypothetical protein
MNNSKKGKKKVKKNFMSKKLEKCQIKPKERN